jgi:hypothetical protein
MGLARGSWFNSGEERFRCDAIFFAEVRGAGGVSEVRAH